ncbi:MAG: hypothetical protein HY898_10740 [Deltaproteobacteria bacterium]|nr:hypothetical protein [Deltaproteobacteria bacterium]
MLSPTWLRLILSGLILSGCAGDNPPRIAAPRDSTPARTSTPQPEVAPPTSPAAPDATPAEAAAPPVAPAAPSAERAWCLEQTRKHYEVVDGHGDSFPVPPEDACANGFAYRANRMLPPKPQDTWLRGLYEVVILHRQADGSSRVVHTLLLKSADTWGSEVLSDFTTGDVDGDKVPEVFWTVTLHEEGHHPFTSHLMTLSAASGKLKKVELPGGASPAGLKDADGDGLFDVPTLGPYQSLKHPTVIGGDNPWFGEGMFLLHSLGRFRFDVRDRVAQRWTREFCQRSFPALSPGPEPLAGAADYRAPERIVCERIQGSTAARVTAAIRAQCPSFQGDPIAQDVCMRSLLDLVVPTPLTTLLP